MYAQQSFCDEISKSWQMATGFVHKVHWTLCDLHVIIRSYDSNGLIIVRKQ